MTKKGQTKHGSEILLTTVRTVEQQKGSQVYSLNQIVDLKQNLFHMFLLQRLDKKVPVPTCLGTEDPFRVEKCT